MNPRSSTNCAPTLQTERLGLRPVTQADEKTLYRISNDPVVRRYLWDDEPVGNINLLAPEEPYYALYEKGR